MRVRTIIIIPLLGIRIYSEGGSELPLPRRAQRLQPFGPSSSPACSEHVETGPAYPRVHRKWPKLGVLELSFHRLKIQAICNDPKRRQLLGFGMPTFLPSAEDRFAPAKLALYERILARYAPLWPLRDPLRVMSCHVPVRPRTLRPRASKSSHWLRTLSLSLFPTVLWRSVMPSSS